MEDLWLIAAIVLFCLGHWIGGAICLGMFLLIVVAN